jgi:NAD(P)-dependent dehydrogenase (short-subunit alcohol dehydrogenase family)
VLVTGAAKLLGREVALRLAANGWRVAVHYRDSVEDATKTVAACAQSTRGAAAFRTNLGNETAVRKLVPTVVEHMGHLDAVVHCASTFEHDTAHNFSFAAMEKHMRSNAGAAILISQALHAHIAQRNSTLKVGEPAPTGAVVTLLDQKLWNQAPDFVSYTLSKAALNAANSMLALALAPLVRVIGVAATLDTSAAVLLALQDKGVAHV